MTRDLLGMEVERGSKQTEQAKQLENIEEMLAVLIRVCHQILNLVGDEEDLSYDGDLEVESSSDSEEEKRIKKKPNLLKQSNFNITR